jgi:predicted metal-dependent peptidase
MILYYSDGRSDMCAPQVIFGDNADIMLTFFECYDPKTGLKLSTDFKRLKKARQRKYKRYVPYRDYKSDKVQETQYVLQLVDGTIATKPTSLLTSLVKDAPALKGVRICRAEVDSTYTTLYKAKSGKWVKVKRNKAC